MKTITWNELMKKASVEDNSNPEISIVGFFETVAEAESIPTSVPAEVVEIVDPVGPNGCKFALVY